VITATGVVSGLFILDKLVDEMGQVCHANEITRVSVPLASLSQAIPGPPCLWPYDR